MLHLLLVGGFSLLLPLALLGQPGHPPFHFAKQVTAADYDARFVVVKVNPAHREKFRSTSGRSLASLSGLSGYAGHRELIPAKAALSARSRKGPRRQASTVDTGLYFRVLCTPGTSIENFINDLYKTGYFEIVEPEYVNRMMFTPNDPNVNAQYYIDNIRAKEAWDVNKGDASITIAIVDSGGDLGHVDLADNVFANPLELIDGIDNDGNGWIDDAQGWDFIGNDLANLNDPNFIGDNNPQLTTNAVAHGVNVAGCASASTNNGIGIAGVGFKTKLMFTKHTADNQPSSNPSIYLGYDGMYYAALSGADIINTSWGGTNRSQIVQDMINFIADDLGVLVVAAAGNANSETPFYPAAYDNVLSVAATNQQNVRASFSNFGSYVDVAAPGVSIFTTSFGSNYTSTQGTSFSSPITAGAAALVKAQFPSYTPQQIAEQIRVSANATELYNNNPAFIGKLGFGLLDVAAALTVVSPSIRASNPKLLNASGAPAQQGEKGFLTMTLRNILAPTSSALEVSVTENSSFISITKGTIRPGAIPTGGSINNNLAPFEIQIANFVPDNFEVPLMVTFKDGTYVDQQEVVFLLNPTFIDVDENLVTTTVSNTGRIGYEDTQNSTKGTGFVFADNSMLYEMGIIMGTGTGAQLYNNVRATSNTFDQDFVSLDPRISEINPGQRSSAEISGALSNGSTPASQSFQLKYRSLAWKEAPYDKFVIMEYIISNPTAATINGMRFGLFADWDITTNGATDAANWDDFNKLGYVFPFSATGLPHAGIQLLTGTASYYAIDNNQALLNNLFGLYDGFTDTEKWTTLTSGTNTKFQAGSAYSGSDVSHVVSAGPFTIPAGQEVRIAFALHAANSLVELQSSARYADSVYNFTLNAPKPAIADANACYGGSTTLNATGASTFKWYKNFTGGQPFFTGPSFTTPNLYGDSTYYVSNADNSYESVRTPARALVKANPKVSTSGATAICSNESIILSAEPADNYLWSTGATTQAITVSTPGSYSVTVTSTTPACQNTSLPVAVTTVAAPVAAFTTSSDLQPFSQILFTDQSIGATSWKWSFGNGETSSLQNPTIIYTKDLTADVELIIGAATGCRDTVKQTLDVITGLHHSENQRLSVFPNPTQSVVYVDLRDAFTGPCTVELMTLQGRTIYKKEIMTGAPMEIGLGEQPDGIYLVRVTSGDRITSRKVVKIH